MKNLIIGLIVGLMIGSVISVAIASSYSIEYIWNRVYDSTNTAIKIVGV